MTDQPPSMAPTPTPASSPAEVSPALPGSPETRPVEPTTPTPATAAQDPYAGYTTLDYDAMLQEHPVDGMDVKELGAVFPAAHRAISQFGAPGLSEALEGYGAGSDANVIRGLAAFHRDYQSLIREARQVNAQIAEQARLLGERGPRIADAPPLTGRALEAKVAELVERYLPATVSRKSLEAAGFFRDAAVRRTLINMAQETHRLQQALLTAGDVQQQMKERWDSPSSLRELPDGRRFTKAELEVSYGELMQQFMQADRAGDLAAKARLKMQLEKVGKAAFS
jgi:hypothetical protein